MRTLLEAIAFWFDEKIVSYQTEILDEFLAVTATTDLNNPMAQPIRGLQRQPSIEPGIEMETFRDEKQKVIIWDFSIRVLKHAVAGILQEGGYKVIQMML